MIQKEAESSKIIGNFDINKEENKVVLFINPKIFPVPVINKTASKFKDDVWVTMDGNPNEELLVELKPKKEQDLELLARQFNNKLLEFSTEGIQVNENNKTLISEIRQVVKKFASEQEGRITKQSITTLGAILAGIGLVSISSEEVIAGHFCSGGGGGGGGDGGPGDSGSGPSCACTASSCW